MYWYLFHVNLLLFYFLKSIIIYLLLFHIFYSLHLLIIFIKVILLISFLKFITVIYFMLLYFSFLFLSIYYVIYFMLLYYDDIFNIYYYIYFRFFILLLLLFWRQMSIPYVQMNFIKTFKKDVWPIFHLKFKKIKPIFRNQTVQNWYDQLVIATLFWTYLNLTNFHFIFKLIWDSTQLINAV